jgi:hypothetical protein
MDKMYCYLWWEKSRPDECKFGERWVFDGQDPETEIYNRIKDSLGVRKDLLKSGEVKLFEHWDVTEYAKKITVTTSKVGLTMLSARTLDTAKTDLEKSILCRRKRLRTKLTNFYLNKASLFRH